MVTSLLTIIKTTNLIKSFRNGNVSLKGFITSATGLTLALSAIAVGVQLAYKAWDKYANISYEKIFFSVHIKLKLLKKTYLFH